MTFFDLDSSESITLGDSDLMVTDSNNISFTSEQVPAHRYYNLTAKAINVAGTFASYFIISESFSLDYTSYNIALSIISLSCVS